MRHLTLIILLVLAPLSWGEEKWLSKTPFRCVTDFKAGVSHKNDGHVVGEFPIKSDDEYRLAHRSSISQKVVSELESYGTTLDINKQTLFGRTFTTETNSYFIRKVSEDPSKSFSWSSCIATGYQSIGHLTCLWPTKTPSRIFSFNVSTGRFARSELGTWHNKKANSPRDGYRSVFTYGACTPFYE